MHKFHLGQLVEFNPPRGIYAPRGPYVVTAKLPGLGGVFEYRVRNANDNMTGRRWKMSCARSRFEDEVTTDAKSKRLTTGEGKAKPTTVKQKR